VCISVGEQPLLNECMGVPEFQIVCDVEG
jgi:hypothetical protein